MTKTTYSQGYKRLLQLLIEAREQKQYTQAELGALLRKPQSFVSKYERGERRLDIVECLDVADALEIDPHYMLACLLSIRTAKGGLDLESFWSIVTPYELMKVVERDAELCAIFLSHIAKLKGDQT